MKERPILFNAPMVRAILGGTKTQTRRAIMGQALEWDHFAIEEDTEGHEFFMVCGKPELDNRGLRPILKAISCPYGQPGDHLWVKETHQYYDWSDDGEPCIRFEVDNSVTWPSVPANKATRVEEIWAELSLPENYEIDSHARDRKWRPNIFLPRWASRILLEIVSVRVERLQDISEADAVAEGVEPNWCGDLTKGPNGFGGQGWIPDCGWINYLSGPDGEEAYTAVESYRTLWESINGAGSWDANPWVWVVEFKRVTS